VTDDPFLHMADSGFSMTEWLLLERALCPCEARCECEEGEDE
jgi:hypothetical protein